MGDSSQTCCISGLGISGGEPVRCLLLTSSPYASSSGEAAWTVRTPPLRAEYNGYGSIENVHKDDKFIADLWLRGLREDTVEKGLGDNSCHDVPVTKSQTFEEMLDAIQEGRLEVRQDTKNFWSRPRTERQDRMMNRFLKVEERKSLTKQAIEEVLRTSTRITAHYPDPVAAGSVKDKFTVDEPVPGLVRVRFGQYQSDAAFHEALGRARDVVVAAGYTAVIAAGSGRYPDRADVLVFEAPTLDLNKHPSGPQWDMAVGRDDNGDRHLKIGLAMVREDVWQAMIKYPTSDSVRLECINCGQSSCYHSKGLVCPFKSINGNEYIQHPKGSVYEHGRVFPRGIPHVVKAKEWGEDVWYGIEAFKAGTRSTWKEIVAGFKDESFERYGIPRQAKEPKSKRKLSKGEVKASKDLDKWLEGFKKEAEKERARVAALPAEEQAKIATAEAAERKAIDDERRERIEHPVFGDYRIHDGNVRDCQRPGAWIFRDGSPGVISVSHHFSMCLADKAEVPDLLLDAVAELSSINRAMFMVRVGWKPSVRIGPQYPEWDYHVRFAKTLLEISEAREARDIVRMETPDKTPLPMTLTEILPVKRTKTESKS